MGSRVTIEAPAKVNLALHVGPVGADGYHDVSTVMLTVGLTDTLHAQASDGDLTLVRVPEQDFPASDDLSVRAVRALAEATGCDPSVALELEKRIPLAAGLGGGSADCAAALAACCALWSIELGDPVVTRVAAALGADVPFMIRGGCALHDRRGDRHVATLATPSLELVLVNAGIPVPTAQVYRAFDSSSSSANADVHKLVRAVETGEPPAIAAALANDLTSAAVAVAPVVGEVLGFMQRQPRILGHLLAGSGGTVFGIASDTQAALAAATAARALGWWAIAVSSAPGRGAGLPAFGVY